MSNYFHKKGCEILLDILKIEGYNIDNISILDENLLTNLYEQNKDCIKEIFKKNKVSYLSFPKIYFNDTEDLCLRYAITGEGKNDINPGLDITIYKTKCVIEIDSFWKYIESSSKYEKLQDYYNLKIIIDEDNEMIFYANEKSYISYDDFSYILNECFSKFSIIFTNIKRKILNFNFIHEEITTNKNKFIDEIIYNEYKKLGEIDDYSKFLVKYISFLYNEKIHML